MKRIMKTIKLPKNAKVIKDESKTFNKNLTRSLPNSISRR